MKRLRVKFAAMRARLKAAFGHTIYEAAEVNGLAIEYPKGMPAKYTGHLDTHEKPRFIAVNSDLTEGDRVYVIAREIARYLQWRGGASMLVDRRWKSDLLTTAPTETRDFIYSLDVEVKAYWILFWHGQETFWNIRKSHPTTYWLGSFYTAVSDYVFWKLRIRNFLYRILSPVRAMTRVFPAS